MRSSFVRLLATAAIASLALAACGSSSKSGSASTDTTVAPTTAASTEAPTTTAGGSSASASGTTVALAQNTTIGKKILVDSKGLSLYVWDKDTTPGQSKCDTSSQCAAAWPAFYVTGTPSYGTGLSASMFTTITAPNGQKQLAVNGHPLYYWIQDKTAGDAKGQNVNGFYVVGADGKKIDES